MKIFLLSFLVFSVIFAKSQNCDTITNLTPEAPYYMYEFSSAWGYMGGHNGNNLAEWAEQFPGFSGTFQDILILPGRAYAGSASSYITMRVHSGSTTPGAILESKQVLINTLQVDQWNKISFDNPVTVNGGLFISFKLNYTQPQDTFVILSNSPKVNNTAWIKYPMMGWLSYQTFMNGQLNTSFGIAALVCDSTTIISHAENRDLFAVFPNPCAETLKIGTQKPIASAWLINALGHKKRLEIKPGQTLYEINTGDWSPGLWHVVVYDTTGAKFTQKVTKL